MEWLEKVLYLGSTSQELLFLLSDFLSPSRSLFFSESWLLVSGSVFALWIRLNSFDSFCALSKRIYCSLLRSSFSFGAFSSSKGRKRERKLLHRIYACHISSYTASYTREKQENFNISEDLKIKDIIGRGRKKELKRAKESFFTLHAREFSSTLPHNRTTSLKTTTINLSRKHHIFDIYDYTCLASAGHLSYTAQA